MPFSVHTEIMRIISDYSINPIVSSNTPKSELNYHGVSINIILDGIALLSQLQTEGGLVLLVLDEDMPYEEGLHFILLQDQKIIDHISLGVSYAPGIFKQIEVDTNSLLFQFFNDDIYALEISEAPSHFGKKLPASAKRHSGWFAPKYMSLRKVINP
jgi:hypothetical protein